MILYANDRDLIPEEVWIRLEGQSDDGASFRGGTLLNEPYSDFGVHKGKTLTVRGERPLPRLLPQPQVVTSPRSDLIENPVKSLRPRPDVKPPPDSSLARESASSSSSSSRTVAAIQ